MAIDTNLGFTYDEHYPVAGVSQTSQGFRDNFSAIKRAIENIHAQKESGASTFSISSSIGIGGKIEVNIGYKDNALRLPSGNPTGTATVGMLRHTGGKLEIHDGSGWREHLVVDSNGGVIIPGSSYLQLPAGFSVDRPDNPVEGMLRFNSEQGQVEVYRLGQWQGVGTGADGQLSGEGGTITGPLHLLTDATELTHAVNLQSLRTFATNMFYDRANGISGRFNQQTNAVDFTAEDFTISLEGQVVGNAVVTNLSDVTINTILPDMLTLQDVRDEVGEFVRGTSRNQFGNVVTETGVLVNYDAVNNTLEIGVKDFRIDLAGAVTGGATISKLGNVVIETETDRIKGLLGREDGVDTGLPESVQIIDFVGNAVTASQAGNVLTVELAEGLSPRDVRDEVGSFLTGTIRDPENAEQLTESGVWVYYDSENDKLEIGVREFDITLTGAVTGTATVSRLGNTTINTTTNLIKGMNIHDEGTPLGLAQSARTIDFVGNAIQATQSGDVVTVEILDGLSNQDVRDVVGDFVRGTTIGTGNTYTETGIWVNYDSDNNTLELGVKDFSIGLAGAVTGSATISKLGNVVINTSTDLVKGIQTFDEGVPSGLEQSVQKIDFVGGGVSIEQVADTTTVTIPEGLTAQDVRDEVGGFVVGTQRDGQTVTETGIWVNYDSENNVLEVGPQDFEIALTGAVTGAATVSKLGNVTITTTTDRIRGVQALDEGAPTGGAESAKRFDFIGGGVSVSQLGDLVTVDIPEGLTAADVRDEVGGFVSGTVRDPNDQTISESGILVNYDSENNTLEIAPRDFSISLAGLISGSATVSRLGNVTITTSTSDLIKGLQGFDEGVATGTDQTIKAIDFVGGGIAASQVGGLLTVSVPQGLTASDVRDEVGGFVSGTIRDPNDQTVSESGIIVNYDSENNTLEVAPRDFDITIAGAVTGSGTVSRLGNVTITTTTDRIKGIQGFDEGVATGTPETVQEVDFVGGGISASQSGNRLTVNVPEGLTSADIRNEVGGFVVGTVRDPNDQTVSESGINVNYDSENNALEISPRDFTISLSGAVAGSGIVSRLGNVSITTTTDRIRGIQAFDEGATLGLPESVKVLDFVGGGVSASQTGNTVTVNIPQGLTNEDVRNEVGGFVSGTIRDPNDQTVSESGIIVNYDSENNALEIAPRDFDITLSGAVTGSATVSRLGNVTISTSTDRIKGISGQDEGVATGLSETVKVVNVTGGGASASQSGDTLIIDVPAPPTETDIQNTVGSFVSGSVRDPNTQVSTESGIIVNYDSENEVLEIAPRDFTITLTGAVTGSTTISRLNNASITTSADFIKGMRVQKEGILLGTQVRTVNFTGGNATVTGDTATVSLDASVSSTDIENSLRTFLEGSHHTGLYATYDTENKEIDFSLEPIEINLVGAVTGNGTVTYTGNTTTDGKVTIATEAGDVAIEVQDEGSTGGRVSKMNFVGGGVTSAVSIDGTTATVYIPNSPGNEKFLLLDYGSANTPNARKFTAGTGIIIDDGGPGGDYTISASSDAIIAKGRYQKDGALTGERATLNIVSTQEIITEVEDDEANNRINFTIYSLNDGWHRQDTINCGDISDKYGPSIDMGDLRGGIIEVDADMGTIG